MNILNMAGSVLILSLLLLGISCADNGERTEQATDRDVAEVAVFDMDRNESSLFLPSERTIDPEQLPRELGHESVIAYRLVDSNDELPSLKDLQTGDKVKLTLTNGLVVEAQIVRNREQVTGIAGITAEILEPHNGFISFTVQNGIITGNIDLLSENKLFHLRYDRENDQHFIANIDREKLDIVPESEPERVPEETISGEPS